MKEKNLERQSNAPANEQLNREDILNKKIEAILRQAPNLGINEARRQAEQEVDDGIQIWAAVHKKIGWYRIEGEGKEQMDIWRQRVDTILAALQSQNYDDAAAAIGKEVHASDIREKINGLSAEAKKLGKELSQQALTLVAIGLWIEGEQGGEYKMKEMLRRVIWKTLVGESETLAGILNRKGAPNCIDTSYLTLAMAEQYGIQGGVIQTKPGITAHRYFQTSDGIISDYWGLRERGTIAMGPDEYIQGYNPIIYDKHPKK